MSFEKGNKTNRKIRKELIITLFGEVSEQSIPSLSQLRKIVENRQLNKTRPHDKGSLFLSFSREHKKKQARFFFFFPKSPLSPPSLASISTLKIRSSHAIPASLSLFLFQPQCLSESACKIRVSLLASVISLMRRRQLLYAPAATGPI